MRGHRFPTGVMEMFLNVQKLPLDCEYIQRPRCLFDVCTARLVWWVFLFWVQRETETEREDRDKQRTGMNIRGWYFLKKIASQLATDLHNVTTQCPVKELNMLIRKLGERRQGWEISDRDYVATRL